MHNYQQLNLKKKQSKQTTRTGTEFRDIEIICRVISWDGEGEKGGEGTGIKKYNW